MLGFPTNTAIGAILPAGYLGTGVTQCQMVYVNSFDSTGSNYGVYPGYVTITNNLLSINSTGTFTIGYSQQGINTATTIIYQSLN